MKFLSCFFFSAVPFLGLAQVFLNADFEQPLYQTGALEGQDGWFVNGGTVRADVAIGVGTALSRGVHFAASSNGQLERLVNVGTAPLPGLRASADIRFSTIGQSSFFALFFPNGRGLYVKDTSTVELITGSSFGNVTTAFAFAPDRYYNVAFEMNYMTGQTAVFVDGTPILSSAGTTPLSGVTSIRMFHSAPNTNIFDPGKTAQVDNIVVAAVPEPTTLATLTIGAGLAGILRRRKSRVK